MDIADDIYDGVDYLPYFYHVLLQNKNSLPYVLEVDGKVVSHFSLKSLLLKSISIPIIYFEDSTNVAYHSKYVANM